MRNFLATGALGFVVGCTSPVPPGVFDVRSSINERVIGHCVTDSASIETVAYNLRAKELAGAKAADSPIPGFSIISLSRPDYQYVLYVPLTTTTPPYHVVCPLGANQNCTIAGSYPGGVFEAYTSVQAASQVDAAAKAALKACRAMTANNSFKPNPLRGSA
jgi:hypothetical protein